MTAAAGNATGATANDLDKAAELMLLLPGLRRLVHALSPESAGTCFAAGGPMGCWQSLLVAACLGGKLESPVTRDQHDRAVAHDLLRQYVRARGGITSTVPHSGSSCASPVPGSTPGSAAMQPSVRQTDAMAVDAQCSAHTVVALVAPVALQDESDSAILMTAAAIDAQPEECDALRAAANALLAGDGLSLCALPDSPAEWYLVANPADELGRNTPSLQGPAELAWRRLDTLSEYYGSAVLGDAPWRRLSTELQMLFHAHDVNIRRRHAGQAEINAAWCWQWPTPAVCAHPEALCTTVMPAEQQGAQSASRQTTDVELAAWHAALQAVLASSGLGLPEPAVAQRVIRVETQAEQAWLSGHFDDVGSWLDWAGERVNWAGEQLPLHRLAVLSDDGYWFDAPGRSADQQEATSRWKHPLRRWFGDER